MLMMKVVLASDHAGFALKEEIKKHLEGEGVKVVDVSGPFEEGNDYPPLMRKGCEVVLHDGIPGIMFGGSGNGEAMAANKVKGVRAAVGYSVETARLARAHNDANVLSLGARFVDETLAKQMVDVFLSTEFEGGRHERRVADIE
ncbi:RpiB/LacA/LacB family sugar-phosphate isomerase [Candidatus Peregrinibacteria bacterium]|nr:RpiB/LacA/LacB family sugar-phosphate isomerase [Candidatus Peregrinibacteria bacterium]